MLGVLMLRFFNNFFYVILVVSFLSNAYVFSAEPTKVSPDFFEKEVQPILQAHCFSCHGAEKKVKGGLDMSSREALLKGGDNGVVVSIEKPDSSIMIDAIRHGERKMPPKGKLPSKQIETLEKWIKAGVPYSAGKVIAKHHGPPKVDAEARNFWSYKPVKNPTIPKVQNQAWVKNPIDAFILSKLEQNELTPALPAEKTALLRRLYFNVIGLPPTFEEVESFLRDDSPDAYEKRVDNLLNSRHYGEHWARHWLDLVRYAETNSFERDGIKPNAWKYRDYIIKSFNSDKPYNEFIKEQLAGDELEKITRDSLVATAYFRLGIWDDEPADRDLAYFDQLDDIVSTTGQTFLGTTIGCARCHDHKIDPFPQKDYYRFMAFFHGINSYGNGPASQRVVDGDLQDLKGVINPGRKPDIKKLQELEIKAQEHERLSNDINRQIGRIEDDFRAKLPGGQNDDFKQDIHKPILFEKHLGKLVTVEEYKRWKDLTAKREELKKTRPLIRETSLAVIEQGPKARETFILTRGMPAAKGDKVEPGFPSVMVSENIPELKIPEQDPTARSSGRRKVVADWIASDSNPLTARVMANRLWQFQFGRGIVRSSSNFGYMGTPPTHPELLDYLATQLVANGWKLKPIQRMILTSNAFKMGSQVSPQAAMKDPENDLLSHFDLRRLTAEELRDSILGISGNLNLKKVDGPSIYPVIPREVLAGQSVPGSGWGKSTPEEAASRSVFVFVKRSLALPILQVFDAPDPDSPCASRFTTTQPAQALALINSEFAGEQAKILAADVAKKSSASPADKVSEILRRTLQRQPKPDEIERGTTFVKDSMNKDSLNEEDAIRRFCLIAFSLNEFIFLN